MKTQRLISSYDEINDIFCGKIDGKNGYFANYAMNEGIFINIDKNLGSLRNFKKYLSPTHSLPNIPYCELYSLKAICSPTMGP